MGASAPRSAAARSTVVFSAMFAIVAVLVIAVHGETTVKSACVADLSEWGGGPWTTELVGWSDQYAHWIWNAPMGQAYGDGDIVYFEAVHNATAAGTATMSFTADNWAQLSVNGLVIGTSTDWMITYNATVNLKLGTNVIQFMANNTDSHCAGACSFAGLIASMKVGTNVVLRTGPTGWQASCSTAKPTAQPTAQRTAQPTAQRTAQPTATRTAQPTAQPMAQPTAQPTAQPRPNPVFKPLPPSPAPEDDDDDAAQPAAQPTTREQPTAQPTPRVHSTTPSAPLRTTAATINLQATSGAIAGALFLAFAAVLFAAWGRHADEVAKRGHRSLRSSRRRSSSGSSGLRSRSSSRLSSSLTGADLAVFSAPARKGSSASTDSLDQPTGGLPTTPLSSSRWAPRRSPRRSPAHGAASAAGLCF
jgi:hypothetical protein